MICYCSKMDDDDFETYDGEDLPDVRLRDGLDLTKLRLGNGQEFEVEVDDAQNGKVFDVLAEFSMFPDNLAHSAKLPTWLYILLALISSFFSFF